MSADLGFTVIWRHRPGDTISDPTAGPPLRAPSKGPGLVGRFCLLRSSEECGHRPGTLQNGPAFARIIRPLLLPDYGSSSTSIRVSRQYYVRWAMLGRG
jgi:hypothetical protein